MNKNTKPTLAPCSFFLFPLLTLSSNYSSGSRQSPGNYYRASLALSSFPFFFFFFSQTALRLSPLRQARPGCHPCGFQLRFSARNIVSVHSNSLFNFKSTSPIQSSSGFQTVIKDGRRWNHGSPEANVGTHCPALEIIYLLGEVRP